MNEDGFKDKKWCHVSFPHEGFVFAILVCFQTKEMREKGYCYFKTEIVFCVVNKKNPMVWCKKKKNGKCLNGPISIKRAKWPHGLNGHNFFLKRPNANFFEVALWSKQGQMAFEAIKALRPFIYFLK